MCMMYLGELLSEDVFFEEGGEFVVEIIGDAGMGTGGLKAGALYGCEPSEAFLYGKVFHSA